MRVLLALPLALGLAAAVHAGQPSTSVPRSPHPGGFGHGGQWMGKSLFPPDLILSNQIALGLTEEQTTSIKKAINETHAKVLDVQTSLQRVTEQLSGQLDSERVDEAAALALAGQAMDLEKQVKTSHMSLLIRVKNLLTPEQQEKAAALRPHAEIQMKTRRPSPEATPHD